mgnify:CR=1 FL=1
MNCYQKLRTKYQFPQYQKGIDDTEIMDYAFFSETGECFSVKVMNEEEREKFLNEIESGTLRRPAFLLVAQDCEK